MAESSAAVEVHVLLVGEAAREESAVPAALESADGDLAVSRAPDGDAVGDAVRTAPVDCVVAPFDHHEEAGFGPRERLAAVDDTVAVVLVGVPEATVDAALSTGVTDCLSRETVERRPALAARRIQTAGRAARSERGVLAGDQYRRLFEQLPEPVAVLRDGAFDYVNDRTTDLLEADRDEIVGMPVTEVVTGDDREEVDERFRRLTAGETDRVPFVDREIVALDGQHKHIRVSSARIDYEGETAILITARDVTERRERRQRLTWYETMVETIGDVVYTLDEDYYFTTVAGAAEDLTGYTCAELEGSHLSLLLSDADIDRGLAHRQRLIAGEFETGSIEVDVHREDGRAVPVEFRYRRLPFEDDFRGTAGVIRDISERKEHERELQRQNERLEEFASIVSHDLRNPLNVASGRLDLAGDDCDSPHLDAVADAHRRMESLIENTLTLARQGRTVADPQPIDLAECVAEAWAHVPTDDATLVTSDDGTVHGDPDRVQQLLENLIRNAIQHAGSGATVTVGLLEDGFYVADDGPGIPEGEQETVFEPGHTADPDGTGFGLAIVEEIAEAHDWSVAVTDAADGGARFEFTGVAVER